MTFINQTETQGFCIERETVYIVVDKMSFTSQFNSKPIRDEIEICKN